MSPSARKSPAAVAETKVRLALGGIRTRARYIIWPMAEFPIEKVRAAFPALQDGFIFFDNAAGAQSPQTVLDTVANHLLHRNVQRGGRYKQSQEVDEAIAQARASVALLVNAQHTDEISFGMNATSFMRIVSIAIGQSLGDHRENDRREIIVTDLDHEANIAVWLALEREGAKIVWWHFRADGRLHPEDLEKLLSPRTRIVACTLASNAIGSILDIAEVSKRAHAAGAEVFVDAVHYGPHGTIDIRTFDCDYLVCSGYKIFSPHMGFLWGRLETLNALPTFREDFVPDTTPAKLEIGTYIYENVAGMDAAVRYLEDLGRRINPVATSRRAALVASTEAIRGYEAQLSRAMLDALANAKATVYGITGEGTDLAPDADIVFQSSRYFTSQSHGRARKEKYRGARRPHVLSAPDEQIGAYQGERRSPSLACALQHRGRGSQVRKCAG